jgi:peroxin-2
VWDTIKGREGTKPAFRVGQVDAELLDEELLELLKGQVGEALKYYGTQLHSEYGAEILLALRAILFKLTIWDHDASYGASLQGLRFTDARDTSLSRPPPKRWQKGVYGLITVFGRYGWVKWEDYLAEQEGGYDEPSPLVRRLSNLTARISTIHSIAALGSFLTFLYNGRYRTLLDRILRLRLVPTTAHTSREVSFEYLNRQLVWHAFTEFLLFLLPLVGVSRWRRILSRSWRRVVLFFKRSFGGSADEDEDAIPKGELGFLPERTCAICYSDQNPVAGGGSEAEMLAATAGGGVIGSAQTDITNPYEAIPCGHLFCFVCLAQKIEAEEGEGWTCLRCGEIVKECKPWNGDVLEEAPRPSSSKSVGFTSRVVVTNGDDESDDEKAHGHRHSHSDNAEEESLAEVEPMPTDDERNVDTNGFVSTTSLGFHSTDGLGESSEWARASRMTEEQENASVIGTETETEPETETGASTFDSDEDDASEELDEEIEEMNGFD